MWVAASGRGGRLFQKHPSQASTQIRGCCLRGPRLSQGASEDVGLFVNEANLVFSALHMDKLMLLLADYLLSDSSAEPPCL